MGRLPRSFWLQAAVLLYVCFAAIRVSQSPAPWLALIATPLLLAYAYVKTRSARHREDPVSESATTALRVCAWGGALWIAARSGPAGSPAFDAAANLGAGSTAVASLVALARVSGQGGLLQPHKATRSLDAAAFAGLLWGIAVALPAARALLPSEMVSVDPLAIDYATTTAAVGSLMVLIAATCRLRYLRRLELGVADRAGGALALAVTAFAVAVPATVFDVAAPDRVLPVAVIAASGLCAWTATTPEPTTVSSALRGILAIMMLGAPTLLIAGLFARTGGEDAGLIVLTACCASISVGLIARNVARPLAPERSRWLDAIHKATQEALQPEPNEAIEASLAALGRIANSPLAPPKLFRFSPAQALRVDVAGYLHTDKVEAPEALCALALEEPERTLRAEVLRALEVRRPEVRPVIAFFEAQRGFSATVVMDEEGPIGFILLPKGSRTSALSLEEARAVRILADRMSSLLAVSSALARSRERELEAVARADRSDDEKQRLFYIISQEDTKNRALAERAARGVRATAYSPAARFTLDEIERLAKLNAPMCLVAPPGTDPVGWAAIAHLSSPRSGGPFIVVDAANGFDHELDRWQDERVSPLKLADGGSLALIDVVALPNEVQRYIARVLSRLSAMDARSSILPPGLISTFHASPGSPDSDTEEPERQVFARLDESLKRWLGDSFLRIPSLSERSEDLRALALSELARLGLATRGEPLGLSPQAQMLLLEHDYPGNEAELRSILVRAAQHARGPVLTDADLHAVGFHPALDEALDVSLTPPPTLPRRRRRSQRTPRGR